MQVYIHVFVVYRGVDRNCFPLWQSAMCPKCLQGVGM